MGGKHLATREAHGGSLISSGTTEQHHRCLALGRLQAAAGSDTAAELRHLLAVQTNLGLSCVRRTRRVRANLVKEQVRRECVRRSRNKHAAPRAATCT